MPQITSLTKAHAYLVGQKWQVAQSSLYNHRNKGLLQPNSNGVYTLEILDKYAAKHLKQVGGVKSSPETEAARLEKSKAAARKLHAQAKISELKAARLEGSLVPRDLFESELTKRAAVFRSDLQNAAIALPTEIVSLVKGDPSRAAELTQFLSDHFAALLDRYARNPVLEVPAEAVNG